MLTLTTGAAEAWLTNTTVNVTVNVTVNASAANGAKAGKSHRRRAVAVLCRIFKTGVLL
jgi:hypothetical protein